jgi:enoyl-CoA hydratase/carnithine racemase
MADHGGEPRSGVLSYEVREGAAWLTFNRPDAMNALNAPLRQAIVEAVATAERDDEVTALVLCGAGGRAFCAGADLKEIAERDANSPGRATHAPNVFTALRSCRKPAIAAIDGHCLAAGLEVASLCDIRVATEASSFGLPEVLRSMMPDPGLLELPRLMPAGEAARLLLTGKPMPARRAHEVGFVQALLPDRSAMLAEAARIAAEISLAAPLAAEAYKQVLRCRDLPLEAAALRRAALWTSLQATDDRLEGPRAFAEKRKPVWRRK